MRTFSPLGKISIARTRAAELVETMRKRKKFFGEIARSNGNARARLLYSMRRSQRAPLPAAVRWKLHGKEVAGGCNVFADRARLFVPRRLGGRARADPEIILVHRFNGGEDGEQKAALLRRILRWLAQTAPMRSGQTHIVSVKAGVSGAGQCGCRFANGKMVSGMPKN